MSLSRFTLSLVVVVATSATAASAQPAEAPAVTLSFIGGVAAGSSDTGAALGGSVLVDLTSRLVVEGEAVYADRGRGADAISANGTLLVNLRSGGETVPYVAIGGGVYRASFDLGDPRFLGPIAAAYGPGTQICPAPGMPGPGMGFGPGGGFGPSTGTCPSGVTVGWGVGDLPHFYARRLGALAIPNSRMWDERSFTDPAISFGGGLRFDLSPHLVVRPDIRAVVVFADDDTYTVGLLTVRLGYRF